MDKIQNYYKEYKKFINTTDLPDITPIIKDNENDIFRSLAYVDREYLDSIPIPLYISSNLFAYKEQFYKSILYHEFTHIYDYYISFSHWDKEIKNELMPLYSEFHASQIEILANIGYARSYIIFNKFSMNLELISENEKVNVDHYLFFPLSAALSILNNSPMAYCELDNLEYSKNYAKARNNTIYYLGKLSVCEKFAKTKPFNAFHNFADFESDVKTLYSHLKLKNFKEILKAENVFRIHYFDFFKFKY